MMELGAMDCFGTVSSVSDQNVYRQHYACYCCREYHKWRTYFEEEIERNSIVLLLRQTNCDNAST